MDLHGFYYFTFTAQLRSPLAGNISKDMMNDH